MSEKVLCPWCGKVMQCRMMNYLDGKIKAWYECARCGARSPLIEINALPVQVKEAVKAAALRRYEKAGGHEK